MTEYLPPSTPAGGNGESDDSNAGDDVDSEGDAHLASLPEGSAAYTARRFGAMGDSTDRVRPRATREEWGSPGVSWSSSGSPTCPLSTSVGRIEGAAAVAETEGTTYDQRQAIEAVDRARHAWIDDPESLSVRLGDYVDAVNAARALGCSDQQLGWPSDRNLAADARRLSIDPMMASPRERGDGGRSR